MASEKIDIDVQEMTCASCSSRVERSLNKAEGVIEATVNLLGEKATIEFDKEKTNPIDLVEVIKNTGFKVPMETSVLLVDGMTCSACSARVEKVLGQVPGVDSVNVNLSTNKATVEYPSGVVRENTLIKAVEKSGYKAEVEVEQDLDR